MRFIKYIDIYDSFYGEDGQVYEQLIEKNYPVPFSMNVNDISGISPYFGRNGKIFNNVCIIDNRYGQKYKVVGNYNKLQEEIFDTPSRQSIGYYGKNTN